MGGGLALGKEGPLVHTGACIASLLGQVRPEFSESAIFWNRNHVFQHLFSCFRDKLSFLLLIQGGSTKYHLSARWLQVFKSDRDRRDLVSNSFLVTYVSL